MTELRHSQANDTLEQPERSSNDKIVTTRFTGRWAPCRILSKGTTIGGPLMTIEQIQRTARQVGLTVERQQVGYLIRDQAGRVIASQLPKDQTESLVQGMRLAKEIETSIIKIAGWMH